MKKLVKLISKSKIAEETMEFCFEKPDDLNFKAGQHFILKLLNFKEIDEKGNERVFSAVSSPKDSKLCFATRMRDSAFKRGLKHLNEGDKVEIEGPYGQMVLPKKFDKNLVFIAGGIGITPFMSMIRYALQENLPFKIYLFYSNRRPEDSAYLEELVNYDNEEKIRLIATMTQMENSKKKWEGERGYITEEMIKRYIQDLNNCIFYVAGPPEMSLAVRSLLEKIGVDEEMIKSEDFSGY